MSDVKKLLIVEDDRGLRKTLVEDFKAKSYSVEETDDIASIQANEYDFAIVDLRLNGTNGLKALEKILNLNPHCRVVILTGYGSVATAVEAMKMGAINYLHKPASSDLIEAAMLDQLKNLEEQNFDVVPLDQKEHEYIDFILTQNNGNITKTAKMLGLHRQSLQRKLKKYPNQ